MRTAIVVDNSGGITKSDMEMLGIAKMVPISFIVNGEEFYEGQNMTYTEFFSYLADKKTDVSTSQPSIEVVKESWREVLKDNDELVYIVLSSGLSEACNSALNASKDEEFLGRVFVVNNQRVAYMHKMSVYEARYLIDHGSTAKDVKEYLEKTKSDAGVYIAVDTLKYLKKGGRVTPAAAAIGTLLKIKPILQIHGGKLDAYAKVMSMKLSKSKMINATKKEIEDRFPEEYKQGQVYIGMAHSSPDINAVEIKEFKKEVEDAFTDMKVFAYDPLPLFIVCHIGSGSLAVGYCVDKLGAIDYINSKRKI